MHKLSRINIHKTDRQCMNDERVLKSALEGIEFGPGKYVKFSAAPTTARMHLNKSHIRDLAPVSKENNRRILPLFN